MTDFSVAIRQPQPSSSLVAEFVIIIFAATEEDKEAPPSTTAVMTVAAHGDGWELVLLKRAKAYASGTASLGNIPGISRAASLAGNAMRHGDLAPSDEIMPCFTRACVTLLAVRSD